MSLLTVPLRLMLLHPDAALAAFFLLYLTLCALCEDELDFLPPDAIAAAGILVFFRCFLLPRAAVKPEGYCVCALFLFLTAQGFLLRLYLRIRFFLGDGPDGDSFPILGSYTAAVITFVLTCAGTAFACAGFR